MKQHAKKQHFEMTLHYEISKTGIYLRKIIVTHFTCPTMPLQQKPFRSKKNKKRHLGGQDMLTTLTNKQIRKTIEFYKFQKEFEFKVTTPRGAKHLWSNICKATLTASFSTTT